MRLFRPIIPRDEYITTSIERAWPEGEWVNDQGQNGEAHDLAPESPSGLKKVAEDSESPHPILTIIGGTKYDEGRLESFLSNMDERLTLVAGDGRGAEPWCLKWWAVVQFEPWGQTHKISSDPDRFGKSARKVNVEQVLSYSPQSPVLLVGEGERVKQARAWLKRAKWGREVIEIA